MSLYQEYKNWDDFSSEEKLSKIKAFIENEVVNAESLTREEKAVLKACIPAYVPKEDSTDKYIFISYSHKDAKKVYFDLAYFMYNSKTRVRFWYDEGLKFGENWVKDAGVHLEDKNCVGVLFYLSENLLLSPAVFKEISIVKKLKKFWFSVALDPKITSAKPLKKDSVEVLEKKGITLEKLKTLIKFFPDNNTALVHYSWNSDARIKQLGKYFSVVYDADINQVIEDNELTFEEAQKVFEFESTQTAIDLMEENPFTLECKPVVRSGWYIKKYKGNSIYVVIPEKIDGVEVVAISGNILPNHAKTIRIPKTIELINNVVYFCNAEILEKIIVDKDNPVYFDLNGILCDKKQNAVLRAPINWDWRDQFILLKQEDYNKSNTKLPTNCSDYDTLIYYLDEIYIKYRLYDDKVESKDVNELYHKKYNAVIKSLNFENLYTLLCAAQTKNIFKGIKEINTDAFADCKKLNFLFLPDSICFLDKNAFKNSNIKMIFLPENIEIADKCFYGCKDLKSILTAILNSESYKYCSYNQLFNMIALSDTFKIGQGAFEAGGIKEVTLSGKDFFKLIEFVRINNIEKIKLEYGIKEIFPKCFQDCKNLQEITIPSSIDYIFPDAFEGCNNLKCIFFENTISDWYELWDEPARKNIEYLENHLKNLIEQKNSLDNKINNCDILACKEDIECEILDIEREIYCLKADKINRKYEFGTKCNVPDELQYTLIICTDGTIKPLKK